MYMYLINRAEGWASLQAASLPERQNLDSDSRFFSAFFVFPHHLKHGGHGYDPFAL